MINIRFQLNHYKQDFFNWLHKKWQNPFNPGNRPLYLSYCYMFHFNIVSVSLTLM